MSICIQNKHLSDSIEFLYDLKVKGKESRHRTKLIKVMKEGLKELADEEINLLKDFCDLDTEGNPIREADGKYNVSDVGAFYKEQNELLDENLIIEDKYKESIIVVKQILLNYDDEVQGKMAEIYDYLCEQFEKETE